MKTLGIIAEYNPFHLGHRYHLTEAIRQSGADAAVIIMSGSFVQRGEPAMCSKWARAKMALLGGADLVIELPVIYSAQSAEYFAAGAVRLLNELGTDFISFGTESDSLNSIMSAAKLAAEEPPEYRTALADALSTGVSFPTARERAASACGVDGILNTPNNILAVEYLKAMIKTDSKMQPIPILRHGSQHGGTGSASYIRGLGVEAAAEHMPESSLAVFREEVKNGRAPVTPDCMDAAVISRLRLMSAAELAEIADVSEGLENRIKEGAARCCAVNTAADYIKTKRYTHARIRRIMFNAMLGIQQRHVTSQPEYIRVLGMNKIGAAVLKQAKHACALSIITKTAAAPDCVKASPGFGFDLKATDVYSLAFPDPTQRVGGLDYTTSPVHI